MKKHCRIDDMLGEAVRDRLHDNRMAEISEDREDFLYSQLVWRLVRDAVYKLLLRELRNDY